MSLGNGVKLTWLGHATFLLETPGKKRVLIDPWITGNPATPEALRDPGDLDLILLSHGHSDHTGDVIRLAKEKQPAGVLAMVELAGWLGSQGVEKAVGFNKGGSHQAEGITVTLTDAHHSSSIEGPNGSIVYTGEPAGMIITLENGYRIYFAGDTCVFGDMALIGELYEPDLAMLPIGDFFTMGPREAAKAVELLGVKHVLGMHYGTFPALSGTPQGLRDELAKRGLSDVLVEELAPGDTLE
jgi:L-ascorbate metabolism protein UlaG (beta-lactamase superfamily)